MKVKDLRLENQGLTTREPGTYDSKIRDLRLESAIVTARNIILMVSVSAMQPFFNHYAFYLCSNIIY